MKELGWANTDRLTVGATLKVFGTQGSFRLGGCVGRSAHRLQGRRRKWVSHCGCGFGSGNGYPAGSVSMDDVRARLGALADPGLEWLPKDVCVPIDLTASAGREATLDAIVAELERIAMIIDPYVPTYHREPATG